MGLAVLYDPGKQAAFLYEATGDMPVPVRAFLGFDAREQAAHFARWCRETHDVDVRDSAGHDLNGLRDEWEQEFTPEGYLTDDALNSDWTAWA